MAFLALVLAAIVAAPSADQTASELAAALQKKIDGVDVEIRMESWLQSDTIRRMGFGHVVAARRHTLIVERGVSFAAFDDHGVALTTAYASNIFAPQPRYLVRFAAP